MDHALSDILCWLNGFTQGGGEYSPETQYTLRDIRDMIRRAYPTIPPPEEIMPPIPLPKKRGSV